jgi:DNA replication protein DnaC
MSTLIDPQDPQEERVVLALKRLQLTNVREILAGMLSEAAKQEWTYLEFLDQILRRELEAKQGKRIRMGLQIAYFPCVRTIEGFDFSFQPSADERLIRELSTGNFIAHGEKVLMFGPPGVWAAKSWSKAIQSDSRRPPRYWRGWGRPNQKGSSGTS